MKHLLPFFICLFLSISLMAQWRSIRPQQAYHNLKCLDFVSDSVGYIGGEGRTLYFTDDAAQNLQPISLPITDGHVNDLVAISPDTLMVLLSNIDRGTPGNNGTFEHRLLSSFDRGANWTSNLISSSNIRHTYVLKNRGKDTLYVAGEEGAIYRSYDGGANWQTLNFPLISRTIRAMHLISGQELLVAGDSGYVYRSTNAGNNWNSVHQLTQGISLGQHFWNFFALSEDTLYACGRGQSVVRSDDRGQTWQELNNMSSTVEFSAIHFRDTTNGIALGSISGLLAGSGSGTIYRTSDGGRSWTRGPVSFIPGENKDLHDLHLIGNNVIAVGELGRILKSPDYGLTTVVPNEVPNLPYTTDIEILSDNNYVMSCRQAGNTFAHSSDSGKTWTAQRSSFSQTPFFIANNGQGLLVSFTNNKLLRSRDGGVSWTETTTSVSRIDQGAFIDAATFVGNDEQAGNFILSTDTLNTISTVAYPANNIERLQAVDANIWFALDNRRDLYRTTDGGSTWQLMNQNSAEVFQFEDSLNAWGVAGSNANLNLGVVRTSDGGTTWTRVITGSNFDNARFNYIAKSGDVIIASAISFWRSGLLISTDNGLSWTVQHDVLPYGEATAIEINQYGTWIYNDLVDFVIENRTITSTTSSVGLSEAKTKPIQFELFPNPTQGRLNIKLEKAAVGEQLRIFNLTGKLMLESTIKKDQLSLNLDLPTGLYLVSINQTMKKLVVH